MLRCVFDIKLSPSSAPDVRIFERFAKSWKDINHDSFKCGIEDEIVCSKISQANLEEVKKFCYNQLTKSQIRADYKELLQLTLIFLGAERFNFRTPGPMSHARWMAKGIYSIKIFLFREQFSLTKNEENGLRDVCIFLVKLYIKAWYGCTNAITAPLQDLNFVKDIIAYSKTDPIISAAIQKKMSNHLWYLSEEVIALAFFDSNVTFEEKRKMLEKLLSKEPFVKLNNDRSYSKLTDFQNYDLSDFISEKTKSFFKRFGLSLAFLKSDPSSWETLFELQEGWTFCRNLSVVNDTAERGIKFFESYNHILTNSEEEKNLLLQVVEAYKQKYPSYKKSDLVK